MARTEDDLRAAFLLAAQDAPSTAEVLAKLAASGQLARPPAKSRRAFGIGRARTWLPAIAVAAVIAAIVVPITVFGRHSGSGSSASSLIPGAPEKAAAGDVNGGSSAAAASSAASAPFVAPSGPSGPICAPPDVTLVLAWAKDGDRLIGKLEATNRTSTACDLAVKPAIYPLSAKGARLDVPQAVTAEGYAGPSRLLPGASAVSVITWGSWCGAAAGPKVEIDWGTGISTVTVTGPTTPSCTNGQASNLTSNWFGPLA